MPEGLNQIPESLWPVVIAAIAVQLVLQLIAFWRLLVTPNDRLIFGKKWPWTLIIIFGETIGAIIFLAVARKPAEAADPLAGQAQEATGDRASRAADVLYGGREDGSK